MAASGEQEDGWLNQLFAVPSIPANPRDHYPFSKCPALAYRLKLGFVLLNLATALYAVEEPCKRLCILLNCWLIFVTYEFVYRNYPWREPLTTWLWKLRLSFPYWGMVATLCFALLLLAWNHLSMGCRLPHPLAAVIVGWVCCMLIFPVVRYRWHREVTEYDYDQYSAVRPCILTLPRPFVLVYAVFHSPSILAILAMSLAASVASSFLDGWLFDAWKVASTTLLLGCLAALCCHRLPEDVEHTLLAWRAEEAAYAAKIESNLEEITDDLQKSGLPVEGDDRFDRLAVQVPLLQREVDILVKVSANIEESRAEELAKLARAPELLEFRRMTDRYGPYTSKCCIS